MGNRKAVRRASYRWTRRSMVLAAAVALPAEAATKTLNYTSGLWSTTTGWSGNSVPVAADTVNLIGSGSPFTLTFDATVHASNATVLGLTDDATGLNAPLTFAQTAATLTINGDEVIGVNGSAAWTLATGTQNVSSWFYLGQNAGSAGTATLSSGTLNVLTGLEQIGYRGLGIFNQNGGVNNAAGMAIGNFQPGGVGIYNLTNGALLNLTANMSVGDGGTGTFNQYGGTTILAGSAGLGMLVGYHAGATGTVNLSGGLLSLGTNASTFVGYGGNGLFNQSGGTHAISINGTNGLILGYQSGSSGTVNLSAGVLSVTNGAETVGFSGTGVFNQSGGSNSASNLYIGSNSGSQGTYNLSNSASLSVSIVESVGNGGTFNQTGGTNSTPTLFLGVGGSATYNMSNSASLIVIGAENVGYGGTGTFNQTGGTNSTSTLFVGNGSSGTYNLSNSASLIVSGTEYISNSTAAGVFNQTGGTNLAGSLYIGQAGASGTYNLSSGQATILGNVYVGGAANNFGLGILSVNGGNLNAGTNTILVQNATNGTLITLSAGTITAGAIVLPNWFQLSFLAGTLNLGSGASSNSGTLIVGSSGGTGVLNQTIAGGSVYATQLTVGIFPGSTGIYNLGNSASLNVPGDGKFTGETIGSSGGLGTFNQSGGSNTTAVLYLGAGGASGSSYNMSNSATLTVANFEYVGFGGALNINFNQTGGSNTTANLSVNDGGGSSIDTYSLSNTATLTVAGAEYIGDGGNGVVNQTGGNNVAGGLILASAGYWSATYNLSGTGVLTAGYESLGSQGTGIFNQTGGSNITGSLSIANAYLGGTAATAIYNLSGPASLTVNGDEIIGNPGIGIFNQIGGTHTISGTLVLCPTANTLPGSSAATFNLQGGSLTVGTIQLNAGGTFNQTGGTLSYNTFNMAGGTLVSNLTNLTTFNYTNGTFVGRLINQGVVNLNGNLTAGNGLENDTTIAVPTGVTLTLNGSGLDNEGTFNLTGGNLVLSTASGGAGGIASNLNHGTFNLAAGAPFHLNAALLNTGVINLNGSTLDGAGTLTNAVGGTIAGYGKLSASFPTNSGTILPMGGTLNVPGGFVNAGMIQALPGGTLAGGTVTNTGSIRGAGSINSSIVNTGLIEPAGVLVLNGTLANPLAGTITVDTASQLVITTGLATNFGTIDLAGGTFDNNGNPMTNRGNIIGYGLLRTGGLVNSGTTTLSGGSTTIAGPVTNSAGTILNIKYSPALFTGPVVNNGTIKTTSTTATFAGTFSGSGQLTSDPSINIFQSDVSIFPGGAITGSVGDKFTIAGTYTNAGAYLNSGGTLSAQNVINNGTLTQSAGQATMLALSGSGSTVVGGAGTALVTVNAFAQNAITVNSGGVLRVNAHPGAPGTHTVNALVLNGSGTLDVNNHSLLIDSTATPIATVRSYLVNGYNNGAWNGVGGVTSSLAASSPSTFTVGYATAADNANTGLGLTGNQVAIKGAIPGDFTFDGSTDISDLNIVLSNYLSGNPGTYGTGDANYDGATDITDLNVVLSNYLLLAAPAGAGGSAAKASAKASSAAKPASMSTRAVTLTSAPAGSAGSAGAGASAGSAGAGGSAASGVSAAVASGQLELDFTAAGEAFLVGNNVDIVNVQITSAGKSLLTANWIKLANRFTGTQGPISFSVTANKSTGIGESYNSFGVDGNSLPLTGSIDYGQLLASGLSGDLVFKYGVTTDNATVQTITGAVVYAAASPEPATLSLLGLGAAGLLGRRRRKNRRA